MKRLLVLYSVLVLVAAQDSENSVDDGSYETIRQSYSFLRSTMAPPTRRQSYNTMEQINSEIMAMMKKECDKHGSADAFDRFKVVYDDYVQCVASTVRTMNMPNTRNISMVVRTVCSVTPQVLSCVNKFLDGSKVCISEEERSGVDKSKQAMDSLVNYLCFENGKRITSFIASDGPVCVKEKKTDINSCLNDTVLKDHGDEDSPFILKGSKLAEHCKKIGGLQTCLKSKLEECSSTVAADFMDGVVTTMKNVICTQ